MHTIRGLIIPALLLTALHALSGCSSEQPSTADIEQAINADAPLSIMVSILPQRYFAQRVGGAFVEVDVLTPPNYAAETYQITPRQMDALGRANVFFKIGMPFEAQVTPRLESNFPDLRIVDTRDGIPLLSMDGHHHHHDHDHGDPHGHEHCLEGDDFHIWLDPMRVKTMARTMARVLTDMAPEIEPDIAANLKTFEAELEELHEWITEKLKPVHGRVFYVFHPAFGYFADAYGLEQRAIEFEGKSPGPRRLYALIEEIKAAGAGAIFEQPQFMSVELQTIARETGVAVVQLDDLAENYLENMKHMAEAILEHTGPAQ